MTNEDLTAALRVAQNTLDSADKEAVYVEQRSENSYEEHCARIIQDKVLEAKLALDEALRRAQKIGVL